MILNALGGPVKIEQFVSRQIITPRMEPVSYPEKSYFYEGLTVEAIPQSFIDEIYQQGYDIGYEAGQDYAKVPYSRELDFLESSGTQYINTGFKPNQNTRVKILFSYSSGGYVFGSEKAWKSASYDLHSSLCAYNNESYSFGALTANLIYFADFNKNNFKLQTGTTKTFTSATFSSGLNLYLFGGNRGGSLNEAMKGKIYACKIYDNYTLVRDFIPVLDNDGTPSLYDKVNKQFYYNQGSGTFTYS